MPLSHDGDSHSVLLGCVLSVEFFPFVIFCVLIKGFRVRWQLVFGAFFVVAPNVFPHRPAFVLFGRLALQTAVMDVIVVLKPVVQVVDTVVTSPRVVSEPQEFQKIQIFQHSIVEVL